MRSFIALLALLFLALNPIAYAAQRNLTVTKSAGEQKRIALVIGNAAYHDAPLKNPVNDAKAMSDALNKLGFQVIEVTDATQKEMNRAITAFGEKLNAETAALFFYAGHGLQVKGKNYIVPVDAQIKNESAVASESVSVDTVLEQLNTSPVSIVILDACRNNPFERSFRKMGGGGLAQMDAPKGSFIAYATAPGKTAADGDGKNGLFTQELLKHINEPGVELGMMMRRVRSSVAAKSGDAQMPWDSSSMTGEFYFKPGDATQVASLVPVPAQPARIKSKEEIEDEYWDSIKDSSDLSGFEQYRKAYPKGRYINTANLKIAQLKKQVQETTKPAEIASMPTTTSREDAETMLWGEAQKGNSKEDYQAYLAQYPKGKYVAIAKSRIKKLQDDAQDAAEQQEQQAWQNAQEENSEFGYTRYLKNYSNGRYAGLAKTQQEKLKNDLAAKEEAYLWEKAESNDKRAVEAYLNKYPAGRYVAAVSDKLKAIKEEEANFKGPEMMRIPGKNYEMGKYEVKQKEWRAVMGNNPSEFKDCGDNCPVERVSWNDVQEFISKLNAKTGKQYRLPTEAEWKYACYGGSQTEYCGGDNIDAVAWYKYNSGDTTHPVGQKQANGYGLYDMSGNVEEWLENKDESKFSLIPGARVFCGGAWMYDSYPARAAYTYGADPAAKYSYFGFRLARTLP